MHDIFYVSLLEEDTTKKRQVVNKALSELEKELEFEAGDNKEYEVEAIINSAVYRQQANNDQMPSLYYLVLWKSYPEEENTWEPLSAVIYLRKLISNFYKDYLEKPIATSSPLDSAPLMARPTIVKESKQKHGRPSKEPMREAEIRVLWLQIWMLCLSL